MNVQGQRLPAVSAVEQGIAAWSTTAAAPIVIHRYRPTGDQYFVPGGLVHHIEPIPEALARELREELDLDLGQIADPPQLRWVQDQISHRPGTTTPLRRLHLVHLVTLPPGIRHTIATTEQDAEDQSEVTWIDCDEAASLHLYPAIGPALGGFPDTANSTGPVWLRPMNDITYRWR
ncbi:NUDIX domain-containing protein [Streptomyces sp. NPDC059496]|uniref:NUDIX domain-containing protein n=1 Tax=Streptomyces sp. NPDC059496 TaxID=3346851 RepID=UPI0036B5E754